MLSRNDGNVAPCHAESALSEAGLASNVGIDLTSSQEESCSFILESRMEDVLSYFETQEVQAMPVKMGVW
ncbi:MULTISPECIES: hypothetical protein [Burkholderia cepacia complex]|uniref:hypothetical protein n=1 Tax=Burkholderia cepacia complex TaxID=87882 RepID=UPI000AEF69FD|nr:MULTISPECIES: hypothetical protein [Burkholderia cepacia complex]